MVGKIVNVDQLGFDEASRIEGDWSRFSDDELTALSSSKSASSIRNELESGDIALIVDSPSSLMLSKMENGFSVSQQNAPLLSDYGVKKIGHRFSGNYYGGTVAKSGGSLHPAKPMPTYIPEPVIKTQPSIYDPIKISDNLSKPKTNKIFAKSCSQPFGNTEACQKKESINNAFRFWGMFINSAEAMAALPAASVVGSEIALGAGAAQNKSINGKTALALTKVAGNFKDKKLDNMRFSVEMSPVMTTAVVLFKVLHFGDKTQYTEDELRNMKEVQSRIRVQITEPVSDNIYPTVRAYHVDDTRIPVRYVGKNEQGQYSVALEENGPKIYWSPDESGKQVSHTTPSQDDGESFSDFWINPLNDAVNDPSTAYPIPEDSDWRDTVLVFPDGSGIEPLYIVYSIFGTAISKDYKKTFFDKNPELKGRVVVHHAVEQQVLRRYPSLVSDSEIHSLENLRGIPKEKNNSLHLSKIRKEWNRFYKTNPAPSKDDLLDKATEIDQMFGSEFNPPINKSE
ncbi:hypothetical protein UA38_16410 [Photobacterium kishitanii]|uniref:Pyosin/cloacin translocation domain-containing protein n=1 Tax=Photobacterium kishitanii TaxID=318456 RepID=A0AAX0YRW1_9GAMM|nr:S-type pyocin domain-containing protein [Photobacterium kishitanii]KJG56056.1 hypothetical protein UA38_16410 [Photobacterium kishitanii]KJG65775.1 hypothetical protein UA40_10635 [Photobacterium kishitanii]KJG68304.1 hypothetical protein UA41_17685 [Photobacterium kishitanii]PSX19346.1 hypothetical protein C0W70_08985 [Photobacterium kishitanii]PSX26487.1 hypothetical protein C0W52_17735 [Photobacterium kishitanii]